MIKDIKEFNSHRLIRYIVFAVLIIIMAFKEFFMTSVAETKMKASRKIVSVVYDDSGSMKKESNWSSANYAMQSFAALLNKEDDMYITYMSSYKQGAKKVDLTNPQKAVDKIRSEPGEFGKTPIKAVKVAMDKLESINDSDESTQYWLVVFTDGEMSGSVEGVPAGDINRLLNDKYKGKTMPNGSKVYITYMGIGGDAVDVTSDENKGLISVKAGNNIIPALSDISNKVSGRYKYDSEEIKGVDKRTVVLTTRLPLYSISIFSQNSKSKVNNITGAEQLSIERNIKLEYPEKKGYDPNKNLVGNAAMITNGDKVISPGEYTVSFSDNIDLSNIVFMYQPAIEMKILIERNGKTIENTDTLVANDSVDVSVIPINPDTGKEIPESDLPAGLNFNLEYLLNDTKEESDTKELKGVILKEGENEFRSTMKVPDYMPINQSLKFTVLKPIEYGIEVDQPSKVRYSRQELSEKDENGNSVKFYITGDGKRLSKEEQKNLRLVIKDYTVDNRGISKWYIKLGKKDAIIKLILNDDGSYSLYPSRLLIPAFMITAGDYKVDVLIEQDPSKTSQGEFTIYGKASDFKDLIPVLLILLIIMYFMYIVFIKAKFHNEEIIIDVYKRKGYIEGTLDKHKSDSIKAHTFSLHTFLPSPADSIVCQGIRFFADRNSGIIIKTRNLKTMFDNKYQATSGDPEMDFDGLAKRLENGNNIQADYLVVQRTIPIFGKQGKNIYKIYMQ